ncbi:MAG TPA: alpha/beta hydrolase, partial [Rudaea sp.]|nr:alpha/beta hydrolase [Rudaea sp.]
MNETMLPSIPSRSRLVLTPLLAALPLLAANATGVATRIPDSYARPATLASIDDTRHLNLRCTGSGTPTIVLESGSHADSSTWFRLQPLLEKSARVCAYDRAGYGFSDEGPLPRNLDADIADLHALIDDAQLVTPLLLVGHSLGSNIVRGYA